MLHCPAAQARCLPPPLVLAAATYACTMMHVAGQVQCSLAGAARCGLDAVLQLCDGRGRGLNNQSGGTSACASSAPLTPPPPPSWGVVLAARLPSAQAFCIQRVPSGCCGAGWLGTPCVRLLADCVAAGWVGGWLCVVWGWVAVHGVAGWLGGWVACWLAGLLAVLVAVPAGGCGCRLLPASAARACCLLGQGGWSCWRLAGWLGGLGGLAGWVAALVAWWVGGLVAVGGRACCWLWLRLWLPAAARACCLLGQGAWLGLLDGGWVGGWPGWVGGWLAVPAGGLGGWVCGAGV
jgi:hypothetical protein